MNTPASAPGAIVRAAIHPAIGIARVGNSPDQFYIGPEVVRPEPRPPGFYKDGPGALKREAARFRVYGYDAEGKVVRELTAADAAITWSAHLANQKASWYQFQIALDIPEAALPPPAVEPSLRRNAGYEGAARAGLAIDGGLVSISGVNTSGPAYAFNGAFLGTSVYLGELRTDEAGRLLVLGGHGVSASHDGSPATTFANNDGWHDDVADGPVNAVVVVDGKPVPCEGAWVVVAPPNYAPDLVTVRTMYDLLRALFVDAKWLPEPAAVSFTHDILPILQRLSALGWVNAGFATGFGPGSPQDFTDPAYLRKLARRPLDPKDDEFGELRRQVYNAFRVYERDEKCPLPWPWIYGDAMSLPPVSPRQYNTLSTLQMRQLARWAKGDFLDDFGRTPPPPRRLCEVPPAEQPAMLDRAALEFCLADAFHPGCEITWPIRQLTMFSAPFRIKHRPPGDSEPDYGPVLTQEIALSATGPLHAQAPGGLSRWMAVPWQTDTASCQSGYDRAYDPFQPTFWAARVPNQVLTEADYRVASDPALPPEERRAAFNRRRSWMRVLAPNYKVYINQMIHDFGSMGVVESRRGASGDGVLPEQVLVESVPGPIAPPPPQALAKLAAPAAAPAGIGAAEEHELPPEKTRRIRV